MEAAAGLIEYGVLLAIGHQLRQSGLMRPSDGMTAVRLAQCLTVPSIILRSLCMQGPIAREAWIGAGVALVCFATQTAASWSYCVHKAKRERAVLMSASIGSSLPLLGLPLGTTLLSTIGLQTLALTLIINCVAVQGASYLFAGSAGPAFPSDFKHEDGGTYRGQWRGMRKEGLGVYTYASGARYEGEWRDNVKDGRGVYYYPKGGTYEGEWSNGVMCGVGVRTMSTGEVRAGRWKDGQLEAKLEMWQCTYAAEGAAEAALAARRVEVGGGTLQDTLAGLLQVVPLWAGLAALALAALQQPLPGALDAVTGVLAPANKPLCLLAVGMTIKLNLPIPRHVSDVTRVLATRVVVPLAICAALLVFLPKQDMALTAALAAVMCACIAPPAPEVLRYTRQFRLNEELAAGLLGVSYRIAAGLAVAWSVAVILTSSGTVASSSNAASTWMPGLASLPFSGTSWPLLVFCVVGLIVIAAGAAYVSNSLGQAPVDQRVRMVFAGAPGGSSTSNEGSSSVTGQPRNISVTTSGNSSTKGSQQVQGNQGPIQQESASTSIDGGMGGCSGLGKPGSLQAVPSRGIVLRLGTAPYTYRNTHGLSSMTVQRQRFPGVHGVHKVAMRAW